jgi:TPR repeat protein
MPLRVFRAKRLKRGVVAVAGLALLVLTAACADPEELLARGRAAQAQGDVEQAAVWYRKAARRNQPRAQINLGWLYFHGKGVSRDLEQAAHGWRRAAAYVWFVLAAERGHRTAGTQRDELAASLSPQERERALGLLAQ